MVPGAPSDAVAMKRDAIAGASVCSNCNSDDRWILHHVHLRKTFRLLCTSCVLKLHSTFFCPICFSLHHRPRKSASPVAPAPPPPPPDPRGTLVCFKCNSVSHANCVAPNTPKSPYLCPTCLNPNSKLFDLCKSNSSKSSANNQSIDLKQSKALRAAAMIAMNSLNEATDQARVDAERKAKEAVASRKRAKDALERVALVWSREVEKTRLREGTGEEISVSNHNGLVGFKPKNAVTAQAEKKDGFNNGALGVNKVSNGHNSGSQHIQKNK